MISKHSIYSMLFVLLPALVMAESIEEQKDNYLLENVFGPDISYLSQGNKARIEHLKQAPLESLNGMQVEILNKAELINKQDYQDYSLYLQLQHMSVLKMTFNEENSFSYGDVETRLAALASRDESQLNPLQKSMLSLANKIPIKPIQTTNEDDILKEINNAIASKSELNFHNIDQARYINFLKFKTEGLTTKQQIIAQALKEYEKIRPKW